MSKFDVRDVFIKPWLMVDRLPLRTRTLTVSIYTATLAVVILLELLAATVAPREIGNLFAKSLWLIEAFLQPGFIVFVLVQLGATFAVQFWACAQASRKFYKVMDSIREGSPPEAATIRDALDELAVYPFKAAIISLSLWALTGLVWYIALNIMGVFPDYINLFVSVAAVAEGCLAAPFQYHLFRLLIENDYNRLSERLDEPYFPERVRFLTFRNKLGVSITVLVFFSLLALFASNTLLAWEGVKAQTSDVGRRLLDATSLGIASIRREVETEAKMQSAVADYLPGGEAWSPSSGEELIRRVRDHLAAVESRVGQDYYLFDAAGNVRFGQEHALNPGVLDNATEQIREHITHRQQASGDFDDFVRHETFETQDLFMATGLDWVNGERWYLGTFYFAKDRFENIEEIVWVSFFLILVMFITSITIAYFIATDASGALNRMGEVVGKVAEGDLRETTIRVNADDEVGDLARSITYMLRSFSRTLESIESSSQSVSIATEEIEEVARKVTDGAEAQVSHSKDTTENMNMLSASIKSIEENVEVLTSSAEESSSNIFEMGSTIEGVANSVSQLFDSVDDSTSVVTEMVASIRQVAESVEKLREMTTDASDAMARMKDAIARVEKDASETRSFSERTTGDAQAGALAVQQTMEGIQDIRKSVSAAAGVIHTLNESADAIGNILNYISDVADQTNLLSLNAGIIAAQAGEHGKGFAVIAKEVSTLAERTARYTREIEKLIADVQTNARDAIVAMEAGTTAVDKGVGLSSKADSALKQILESTKASSERISSIAGTAADQSRAVVQVAGTMKNITEMSEQIAKATQEQSRGSERILESGERMRTITAQVKQTTQEQARNSRTITKAIENINDMVRYINEAQREEVDTCKRVDDLVTNINRVTLQNFDQAVNLDRAITVLRNQSLTLKEQVAQFQLAGNGNGHGAGVRAPGHHPFPGTHPDDASAAS